MGSLPAELLIEILSYFLNDKADIHIRSPTALLTSNSLLSDIAMKILYTELYFKNSAQITLFLTTYRNGKVPPYAPRFADFDFVGTDSSRLFWDIHELFTRCFTSPELNVERDAHGRPCLELLRICANTHAFDYDHERIYDALSLVNSKRFIWDGPNPPHHFSIAIVPPAVQPLFRALSTYTNLIYLKLTYLSMTFVNHGKLPIIPSLQTFHFGQVVFLEPADVSSFVLHPSMNKLQEVKLVDAYKGSIWGARIRRSDIEAATTASGPLGSPNATGVAQRSLPVPCSPTNQDIIRRIVVCKATTERIIGGDRAEGDEELV
ncbi:hypothetical protein D9613_003694 [Agrocybe pediades]|uniref:Uncharacterized protein n=1 Tax=Agrocybe pediades TaxID=84607 RepID=A0A8H4QJT2_9AGAR|nr:hypothetical protein D9613_003694 [Agrocybe pediades]